tara:strand:- start:259 stop:900 length:642 start_codon:yes stop_codon:yes gene_type:complete
MENNNMILIEMLEDLKDMIDGEWFVGDGALLGLTRDHKLIEGDNDIDIFLLPNAKINIPKKSRYAIQKYYMDFKFYFKNIKSKKLNKWLEYIAYKRTQPEQIGLNRPQICAKIKDSYKSEAIVPEFSSPCIDCYYLEWDGKKYVTPKWPTHWFKTEELMDLPENTDLGFSVPVPNNVEDILERQYGKDWRIPDPNFSYFKSGSAIHQSEPDTD